MPRGGYQGGIRPHVWTLIEGEVPPLKMLQLPRSIHPQAKVLALLLDKQDPRILAFLESLKD
jgi:hypothetical protein